MSSEPVSGVRQHHARSLTAATGRGGERRPSPRASSTASAWRSRGSRYRASARSWASTRPAACPRTSAPTCTYQTLLRRDECSRSSLCGAEEVRAIAEGVARQVDRAWPRRRGREVVRDDVGERDRHQRVREAPGELAGACPSTCACRRRRAGTARRRGRPWRAARSCTPPRAPTRAHAEVDEEPLDVGRDVVPQRALREAVERRAPDGDREQRDVPGGGRATRRPRAARRT